MFSFFKKSNYAHQDYSLVHTDIHSHLIPGIDDGAKTVEESVVLIRHLMDLGFKKIITTPHIMGEYYPNTPAIILAGLEKVRAALQAANLPIAIDAAAEYYVDEFFEDLLAQDVPLLTLPGQRILIEVSMMAPPRNLAAILFQLNTKGYQPILAHPERYVYYAKKLDRFKEFKAMGCTLQLNLLSLTGYYGKTQKKLGYQLLQEGLIDFVGTDMHHERHAQQLQKYLSDKAILKVINQHSFANTTFA
ncbi:MAG: CpsB/CapC family capsule biosynthesis tyrosine phosphatase [Bacteroidota bacterium]